MRRLIVHVEGWTERDFVNQLLRPHLARFGYGLVNASLIGKAHQNDHKGGTSPWVPVRQDIVDHLREDTGCLATTMVDFYGMPKSWPGRKCATGPTSIAKARSVEAAILQDLSHHAGQRLDLRRFRPFAVMHEFEAWLFSDTEKLAAAMGQPDLARQLAAIRTEFANPEDISDSKQTAPSKRIERLYKSYQKRQEGIRAAESIGLPAIRDACPHFAHWLNDLETWPERLAAG